MNQLGEIFANFMDRFDLTDNDVSKLFALESTVRNEEKIYFAEPLEELEHKVEGGEIESEVDFVSSLCLFALKKYRLPNWMQRELSEKNERIEELALQLQKRETAIRELNVQVAHLAKAKTRLESEVRCLRVWFPCFGPKLCVGARQKRKIQKLKVRWKSRR